MVDQSRYTLRGHGGNSVTSVCFLDQEKLVSCDDKGDSLLVWDISKRRVLFNEDSTNTNGGGLSVVKCKGNFTDQFVYQRKNSLNVYDSHTMQLVHSLEESTFGFCKATVGNNLVVYPSSTHCNEAAFKVWDQRANPRSASKIFASQQSKKFGMMTSLAVHRSICDRLVVACGMDSGDIIFHSLRMNEPSTWDAHSSPEIMFTGREPVLSMDIVQSLKEKDGDSIVGIAGVAGNIADMSNIEEKDRGTLITFKVKADSDGMLSAKIRKRILTCPIDNTTTLLSLKPSIACCKFRDDGRFCGVASWDRRLRIYSRTGKLLAILKGHSDSINCMDWQPNSSESIFSLATGGSDGYIKLWDVSL